MILPKIIKWITLEQLEELKTLYDNAYGLDLQRKKELSPYAFECDFDNWHEDILIQEIVKNNYIICGDTHQNLAIPVFNDGYLMLSMRRWAEVMSQAYGNQHNFYMAAVCDIQEELPNE